MTSTTASYLSIANNLSRYQSATEASPTVKTDTAYYLANIGKVTSIADFVNNYRLLSYALTAFGLGGETNAKGLVTKVLEGGVSNSKSLANTLTDPSFTAFATAFDFAGKGVSAVTASSAATTGTTSQYVEQTLETTQGQSNEGVQLALYFARVAPTVTSTYGLLADSSLLKVVQTAYGIQPSASINIDTEAAALGKIINVTDLKNPAKLKQLIERFAANYDLQGDNTASSTAGIAQIFASSSTTSGFSANLLLSIQGLRLGGS